MDDFFISFFGVFCVSINLKPDAKYQVNIWAKAVNSYNWMVKYTIQLYMIIYNSTQRAHCVHLFIWRALKKTVRPSVDCYCWRSSLSKFAALKAFLKQAIQFCPAMWCAVSCFFSDALVIYCKRNVKRSCPKAYLMLFRTACDRLLQIYNKIYT